jgi:hypothetical protein
VTTTEFKNVRAHAVDVGGRMLAPSSRASLDPSSPPVADAVAAGHLVAIQSQPSRKKPTEES